MKRCETCGKLSEQTYCCDDCARTGQAYRTLSAKRYEARIRDGALRRSPCGLPQFDGVHPDGAAALVEAMARQERRERRKRHSACTAPCQTIRWASYVYGADIIELLKGG